MSDSIDISDLKRRMAGAVDNLKHEFAGLRTGRASAAMLDPVTVDVYGASMPLTQVGTVSVPEPRMLSVQVWDANNTGAVEKAIRNSGLGLNPMSEGATIRIVIPELNEERRKELTKVAAKYAEQARIAVRNVRRDGMDQLKRAEKDGLISQDEHKVDADKVQSATDTVIAEIDQALTTKEKEILQV